MSDYWSGYSDAMSANTFSEIFEERRRYNKIKELEYEYAQKENQYIQRENRYVRTIERMQAEQEKMKKTIRQLEALQGCMTGTIANYERFYKAYDKLLVDLINTLDKKLPLTEDGVHNIKDVANLLRAGKRLGEPEADTAAKLINQLRRIQDDIFDKAKMSAPEDHSDTKAKKISKDLEDYVKSQIP